MWVLHGKCGQAVFTLLLSIFLSSALYGLWLNLERALSALSQPPLPCSGLINFVGITLVVATGRLF